MFVIRLGALLLLTFGGLAFLMYPDIKAAAGITGLGAVVALAWYFLTQHGRVIIRVDQEEIRRMDREGGQRIRWVDVSEVEIAESLFPTRTGVVPLRYAIVRGMGRQQIAFADLTFIDGPALYVAAPEPTPITDVAQAEVLLALVADRVGDEKLLPDAEPDEEADESDEPAAEEEEEEEPPPRDRKLHIGLLALLAKLGSKAVKPVIGMFKGTQGVLAAASVGALALLWSWEMAIAVLVLLMVHELGHYFAMRRAGLEVKGIYLIPILGAATVPKDQWRTRSQQAAIALAGPLWSTVLNLIPFVIVLATGDRYPLMATVAGIWALFNFLNLLPISPLDGGRLLSALGNSISSGIGTAISLGAMLLVMGIAILKGLYLVPLLGLIGLAEIASERSSSSLARKLEAASEKERFGPTVLAWYRQMTRPGFPDASEDRLREAELSRYRHMVKLGKVGAMTAGQGAFYFSLYIALGLTAAAILYTVAAVHPELSAFLDILR